MDALDRLHTAGIVHRDLKPANILIDSDGHLVIGDLGLAHIFDENSNDVRISERFCGTPGYMSPEMIRRMPYSYAADIWSLGVIFFEIIFGTLPWVGDSPDELFYGAVCENLVMSDNAYVTAELHELLYRVRD